LKDLVLEPAENAEIESAEINPADKEENLQLAKRIGGIILDKKGRDVVIIDISAQSSFADYFVNATALNTRMLDTLHSEIDGQLTHDGARLKGVEGNPASGWILMDFGDVIVNLFMEEQRGIYQIEKIWRDGTFISIDDAEV
jgi:ribosome-associated protein